MPATPAIDDTFTTEPDLFARSPAMQARIIWKGPMTLTA